MAKEEYTTILDMFSQKLINSGYVVEQVRRIIVAGIKGWGGKVNRCREEGRRLRRTAKNSMELRMRTKLVGKSSWFKSKRVVNPHQTEVSESLIRRRLGQMVPPRYRLNNGFCKFCFYRGLDTYIKG